MRRVAETRLWTLTGRYNKTIVKERGKRYYDFLLEHEVRHITMKEQAHITELKLLLGRSGIAIKLKAL